MLNEDELFELLGDVNALPKTWNPIKLMKRSYLRNEIYRRIGVELEKKRNASQKEKS